MESNQIIIEDELRAEFINFEDFFENMGFKRIEGTIYGLLVLSNFPLASEEIESTLEISQSACSQGLKKLHSYGITEALPSKDRRCKLHFAKENSLQIVGSIFQKRERESIQAFKRTAERALIKSETLNPINNVKRKERLESLVTTCELADIIMNFIVQVCAVTTQKHLSIFIKKLPQMLDLLANSGNPIVHVASGIVGKFKKDNTSKYCGDNEYEA